MVYLNGGTGQGSHVNAESRLEQFAEKQSEHDRNGCGYAVVYKGQSADLARAARFPQRGSTSDQREQDEWDNNHFDELHEQVAHWREHVGWLSHKQSDNSTENGGADDPDAESVQTHAGFFCVFHWIIPPSTDKIRLPAAKYCFVFPILTEFS